MFLGKSQFIILISTFYALCLQINAAARILAYFPTSTKSHLLIHCAVARVVAESGHNVTVVSYAANVYEKAPYKYIQIGQYDYDVSTPRNKPAPMVNRVGEIMAQLSDRLSHADMQRFLNEHGAGSFDLLILGYYMNNFHLGLAAHFQCPAIFTLTFSSIALTDNLIGNVADLATVPTALSGLKQPMDFGQRLYNIYYQIKMRYNFGFSVENYMQEMYIKNFPPARYPPYDVVRKNLSLIFASQYFTEGPIRATVPAHVEIGGIQIKDHVDALPADIARILDNSKHGVIFVSFGTKIKPSELTAEKKAALFAVFESLPYDILWKWDSLELPRTARNIHYHQWLPQSDILAHANLKLFITHGGLGSLHEAQYNGVPLIGIPFMSDQPYNCYNLQSNNFGLAMELADLTAQNLKAAILEVMHNPKYTTAVKQFSILYKDRPMTPKQTVKYWVDYVLRYNGAFHMQSPAVHLNTIQLYSLDILLFLLIIFIILYYFMKFIYKIISHKILKFFYKNNKKFH